jgi:hypothetical protein
MNCETRYRHGLTSEGLVYRYISTNNWDDENEEDEDEEEGNEDEKVEEDEEDDEN